MKENNFTSGPILGPLMKFATPVFIALFLQAMYGAVDLLVVGRFASPAHQSAVATGSQLLMTITGIITNFAMGITIYIGHLIGEGNAKKGGKVVGTGICLFGIIGGVMTVLIPLLSKQISSLMNAPEQALDLTSQYVRICGLGIIVIIAYNLIGSIFRGLGDSRTPLITVAIACAFNIAGDLLLVAVLDMGTAGAAIATVCAQLISVIVSMVIISKRELPFTFSKSDIRLDKESAKKITAFGLPMALQDFLVGISFLFIIAIVNNLGVAASAGIGVAEKVCVFIMLIPLAFMQAMSAFVAQNYGAGEYARAKKSLKYAIELSVAFGVVMFAFTYFRGDLMAVIFSKDSEVVYQAADYLRAYGIDCLFTCFLFCFIGYFNGLGHTRFVMAQGLIGAFLVRIPVCWFMSRWEPVTMFHIGLGIPVSTVVQIIMCGLCFVIVSKKLKAIETERLS